VVIEVCGPRLRVERGVRVPAATEHPENAETREFIAGSFVRS